MVTRPICPVGGCGGGGPSWFGRAVARLGLDVGVAGHGVEVLAVVFVGFPESLRVVIGTMLSAWISIAWRWPSAASHSLHFRRPESTTLSPLARFRATHSPMPAQIVTLKNWGRLTHSSWRFLVRSLLAIRSLHSAVPS
jgi:hypothetical protein